MNPAPEVVQKSLEHSVFQVCVYADKALVGFGRIVGDGAMYFYLQDIVVAPSYQNQGVGKLIMGALEAFIKDAARSGATVALLAAFGKENFYHQFGYNERDGNPLGFGMCKFIK